MIQERKGASKTSLPTAIAIHLIVVGCWPAHSQTRSQIEQGMREGEEQVQRDKDGAKWKAAEQICAAKVGLPMVPKDGQAVARAYGVEKAIAYTDCFVNSMYPVPR